MKLSPDSNRSTGLFGGGSGLVSRESIGRGTLRVLVLLLASTFVAPIAGADDYLELLHAQQAAAMPCGSLHGADREVVVAEEEPDFLPDCPCPSCLQMLLCSWLPAKFTQDEGAYSGLSSAARPDSAYHPEIYRPPSV